MQVNNLSVTNNLNVTNNKYKSKQGSNRQSFKGWKSCLHYVGDKNKALMHFVEKGGFFAEFCIMDMCGLVLPRVWQGFHRNKEELGHLNYQAGMEELLREAITGPSMFLIPMGAVLLAGRIFGKATQIKSDVLTKFSEVFSSISGKVANSDNQALQKDFAGKLFDTLFTNAENKLDVKNPVKSLAEYKNDFVSQLTDSIGTKFKMKEDAKRIGKFKDLIANIHSAFFTQSNREYTFGIPFKFTPRGKNEVVKSALDARDLYEYARKYMEDVIPSVKLSVNELTDKGESAVKDVVKKIMNTRLNCRELLCVGGTLALAGFLCLMPKIYQLSKKNPALNGLEGDKKEVAKK